MERLYRIEELCTSGWQIQDDDAVKMTKEQATQKVNDLLAEGYNPNRLRVVVDE